LQITCHALLLYREDHRSMPANLAALAEAGYLHKTPLGWSGESIAYDVTPDGTSATLSAAHAKLVCPPPSESN